MSINPDKLKMQTGPNVEPQISIEKELEEQREILLKIYEQSQKTRRYIMFGKIISFIYLLLLIVPIIFAFVYLPPLLKNVIAPYQELLGQTEDSKGVDTNQLNSLLNQFK